jgi:hypothetical protein
MWQNFFGPSRLSSRALLPEPSLKFGHLLQQLFETTELSIDITYIATKKNLFIPLSNIINLTNRNCYNNYYLYIIIIIKISIS